MYKENRIIKIPRNELDGKAQSKGRKGDVTGEEGRGPTWLALGASRYGNIPPCLHTCIHFSIAAHAPDVYMYPEKHCLYNIALYYKRYPREKQIDRKSSRKERRNINRKISPNISPFPLPFPAHGRAFHAVFVVLPAVSNYSLLSSIQY